MSHDSLVAVDFDGASPCMTGGRVTGWATAEWHPGGPVAEGIVLQCGWRTTGPGSVTSGTIGKLELATPELGAVPSVRVPFAFTLPSEGPVSSSGALVGVEWRVQATLRLPGLIDPTCEQVFTVAAGPGARALVQDGPTSGGPSERGCATWALRALVLVFLPLVGFGCWLALDGWRNRVGAEIACGLFVAALGGSYVVGIGSWLLAHRAVGFVVPTVTPARVRPGEEVEVELVLPGRVLRRRRDVQAALELMETATHGSGRTPGLDLRTTHREGLPVTRTLAGDRLRCTARARLPEDARSTISVPRNSVTWVVKLSADLRGLPDAHWSVPVVVDPAPGGAAADGPAPD